MATLYHHRIYCLSHATPGWVYKWKADEAPLSCCPEDPSHTVQADSASIDEVRDENTIHISKEKVEITNGHIRVQSFGFTVPAGGSTTLTTVWPYNITIYTVRIAAPPGSVGCTYTADVNPRTPFGQVTTEVPAGTATLTVAAPATAWPHVDVGYILTLKQGSTFVELGEIIALNKETGVLTVQHPPTVDFLQANGPIIALAGARPFPAFEIGAAGLYTIGDDHPSSLAVPAGIPIVNTMSNPNSEAVRIVVYVHHCY